MSSVRLYKKNMYCEFYIYITIAMLTVLAFPRIVIGQLYIYIYIYIMVTSSNGNISALLAFCAVNSPVTGEFPAKARATEFWCILWSK